MTKLTRKQIQEGLKQMPIDTLLLGATSKTTKLTPKQMKFAEEIAKGNSKAEAYRKAYNSKGKPKTQSNEGQKLTKDQAITAQIDAFKVAIEAQKYQTPAHLRSHIIHSLTQKTLDKDVPHAQQLKALELLGKITEVALFTERREIVKTDNSEVMKEKLIKTLSMAIKSTSATDVPEYSAESLLAELTGEAPVDDDKHSLNVDNDGIVDADAIEVDAEGVSEGDFVDPTIPDPPKIDNSSAASLHSIPHNRSATFENSLQNQGTSTLTHVRVGEGGIKNPVEELEAELRTPPLSESGSPTEGGGI